MFIEHGRPIDRAPAERNVAHEGNLVLPLERITART